MTAQPQRPLSPDDGRAGGLKGVTHVIAVSSCKGGALYLESYGSLFRQGLLHEVLWFAGFVCRMHHVIIVLCYKQLHWNEST